MIHNKNNSDTWYCCFDIRTGVNNVERRVRKFAFSNLTLDQEIALEDFIKEHSLKQNEWSNCNCTVYLTIEFEYMKNVSKSTVDELVIMTVNSCTMEFEEAITKFIKKFPTYLYHTDEIELGRASKSYKGCLVSIFLILWEVLFSMSAF